MPDIAPKQQIGVVTISFALLTQMMQLQANRVAMVEADNGLGELKLTLVGPDMPEFTPGEFLKRVMIHRQVQEDGSLSFDVTWPDKES
jgi:hypothetical protein